MIHPREVSKHNYFLQGLTSKDLILMQLNKCPFENDIFYIYDTFWETIAKLKRMKNCYFQALKFSLDKTKGLNFYYKKTYLISIFHQKGIMRLQLTSFFLII